MDDFESEDDFFEYMLDNGYIEHSGVGKTGEPTYKITEKLAEEFPEAMQEHLSNTNNLIFDVWQKGLIEVVMDDDANWIIKPNNFTINFMNYEDELTEEEWSLLSEINRIMLERGIDNT